jgi:carbonic anhydrase/acetyltransferase-like protein (isoleucine patch superfamily)
MNGARIGRGSILGAGSVITEGKQFPEHSLIIGAPARVIRTLKPAQVASMGNAAKFYVGNASRFRKGLKKVG